MTLPNDVTDRLAALEADNARLRRLLDRTAVTDAFRHTLHDTVALLRTIVRRSSETAQDLEGFVAHLEARIDSLMRMRARTDAFGEADLHLLVSEELMVHLVREGERATIEGPPVRLRPHAAQTLALAMHELVSNAVEHGPLDSRDGSVSLNWHLEPGEGARWLVLTWQERGGVCPVAPKRRGFGRDVLKRMLADDLGARTTLVFAPAGLICTIRLPFTARLGRLDEGGAGVL